MGTGAEQHMLLKIDRGPNQSPSTTFPGSPTSAYNKALVETLLLADIGVASVFLQENTSTSDAAPSDARLFHIYGKERLQMPLLGLNFEIGPLSCYLVSAAQNRF